MRKIKIEFISEYVIEISLDDKRVVKINLFNRKSILLQKTQGENVIMTDKDVVILENLDGFVKIVQGDGRGNNERLLIQFGSDRFGVEKEYTIYTTMDDSIEHYNTANSSIIYKSSQLIIKH